MVSGEKGLVGIIEKVSYYRYHTVSQISQWGFAELGLSFFFLSILLFSLFWCIGLVDWLVEEFGGRAALHSTGCYASTSRADLKQSCWCSG